MHWMFAKQFVRRFRLTGLTRSVFRQLVPGRSGQRVLSCRVGHWWIDNPHGHRSAFDAVVLSDHQHRVRQRRADYRPSFAAYIADRAADTLPFFFAAMACSARVYFPTPCRQ